MGKSITFSIQGSDELIAAMQKLQKLDEVKRIVKTNGVALQSNTMSKMDATYTRGYSTGATKRSTSLKFSDGGLTATVHPGTTYFPYLELGTRFMAARPTLKPAFDKVKLAFKKDLEKLVK